MSWTKICILLPVERDDPLVDDIAAYATVVADDRGLDAHLVATTMASFQEVVQAP